MSVCTQNDIHLGNFTARYKMKVGMGNFTYRNLVYLSCLQVIFLEKELKNSFRSALSRHQNGSFQGIPLTCVYKQKLETSVDFHQQAPLAQRPISRLIGNSVLKDWAFLISISFGVCLPRHGWTFKFIFLSYCIIYHISCLKNKSVRR